MQRIPQSKTVMIDDDLANLEETTNRELEKVSSWFEANTLALHPKKTRYILFTINRMLTLNLNINGVRIEKIGPAEAERAFKFLGEWLDPELNFKEHARKVEEKINKLTYSVVKMKRFLRVNHKALVYKGLINRA